MDEDEASFGTRCSSRTGECSNSVDTTVFSMLSPSSELRLWISSGDGSCTGDEVAIVRRSVRNGRCQEVTKSRDYDLHSKMRQEVKLVRDNSHDGESIPLRLHASQGRYYNNKGTAVIGSTCIQCSFSTRRPREIRSGPCGYAEGDGGARKAGQDDRKKSLILESEKSRRVERGFHQPFTFRCTCIPQNLQSHRSSRTPGC